MRLMIALSQNKSLSIEDLGVQLNMSNRSLYRYMEAFRQMGFIINKEGIRYRIDRSSPLLQKLLQNIELTEDEVFTLATILSSTLSNDRKVNALRSKFSYLYNIKTLTRHGHSNSMAEKMTILYRAMLEERVVSLHNYTETESEQPMNYIVEPYLFTPDMETIWAYSITARKSLPFKLACIKDISLLDLLWEYKKEHDPVMTDLFDQSGNERKPLSIILTAKALGCLLKQYPGTQTHISRREDGRHLLKTEVCDYAAPTRFVIGLYDEVEILNNEFKEYVEQRFQQLIAAK